MPDKNLKAIGGYSLVEHALFAARDSGCFSDIVLSSDDERILALGAGVDGVHSVPRLAQHATDTATVFKFIGAMMLEARWSGRYDAIALLLPTAPFRSSSHVREACARLDDQVDAVVSVTAVEYPPQLSLKFAGQGNLLVPLFEDSPLVTGNTRSQDQEPAYKPNGAIYLGWWDQYLTKNSFYTGRISGYVMSRIDSTDIDNADDLELARLLVERNPKLLQGRYK